MQRENSDTPQQNNNIPTDQNMKIKYTQQLFSLFVDYEKSLDSRNNQQSLPRYKKRILTKVI